MNGGADAASSVPERWFVLTVRSDSTHADGLLVDPLLSLGGRAVEERDGEFVTHLEAPEQPEEFLLHAAQVLREATGLHDLELSWTWQVHEDWASTWKQGLAPRKLTDRLIVSPSWCEEDADQIAGDDSVVIVIDPGMAFGTAEHGTTRGALRLLDRAMTPGETVLDAGCGSAILAIAAAKLGVTRVLAVDLDPYATEAARDNAAANEVADQVLIETASVSPDWIATRGPFDGILANIQTEVLVPLLESFAGTLGSGGWLILSGILDEEWSRLAAAAADHGFSLVEMDADGEWRSGCFTAAVG